LPQVFIIMELTPDAGVIGITCPKMPSCLIF
jgi:hypothetical protein